MRLQRRSCESDKPASSGRFYFRYFICIFLLFPALLLTIGLPVDALALTKPTQTSPANYAVITSTSCTFSWTHPYNDLYEIKIKTSGGTLKYASGKISSKSKTVDLAAANLTSGSTYKWYVVVYALGQEDSSADRWFTYQPTMPGAVSVSPSSGAWTTSPQNVSVSSTNASRIYYTIRTTTDGTTPADPPEPTSSTNDGSISGSSGTFQVYASAGQNKKLKVRFRGQNSNGYGATTGSYVYSINLASAADDHGNSCSTATTMSLNSSKTGVIGTAGDYDYFKVTVTSAGTLTAYSTGTTDTYGYLKNSGCSNIKYDDDAAGDGKNFSFSSPVTAGTYYIAVRHYSSTGLGAYSLRVNFALSAADDHGNSCSTATTMSLNSSKTGVIGTAGDYDYFKVTVTSAGTLTAYSTGTTDTYGYLKNSGCSNIKYDDDAAGDGKNFSFSSPVTAGTYYITVRHYSSTGLGAYGLRVNFFVPIGPVSVNPTFGTWTSSPRNVSVSSTNASRIYYTIRTTTDGTTPVDPPVPTSSANDGYITGSSGTFQVYASAGQNKKLKVRFRGYNNGGYGATTGSYAYSINLAINNNYIYYPLAANLTVPISSVTIATPFGAQAFGGTHTGVDIMKPINTIVYSIGDGVVRINNTNKNSGSEYLNYWNSFLVIYYPSLDRFVYYGHLSSSLTDNASVKKYQPLGNLRGSYNSNNVRTPSNDHLHLGVKTDYIESGWGYTAAGTSITALEGQGWRDPVKFMRGQ